MEASPLPIRGAWEFLPRLFPDERGVNIFPFQAREFERLTGRSFEVAQVNHSVNKLGVVRGIHLAQLPPGQAKYVYCSVGRVIDVIVDLRVGSPTFGEHTTIELRGNRGNAVYVPEGLGHGFVSCEDDSVVSYLCSSAYAPDREFGVNPFDAMLNIDWQGISQLSDFVVLDRDRFAPQLSEVYSRLSTMADAAGISSAGAVDD